LDNYTLKTIDALKDATFVVEKYQRGYKWGLSEVRDLLTDINGFDPNTQAFYCLQPVVLKEIVPEVYELIDGQQRLTTIFIILRCLGVRVFDLKYRTRPQSEVFLSGIRDLPMIELEDKRADFNKAWESYLQNNRDQDNVDNYHFYSAYQLIVNWLLKLHPDTKQSFEKKLRDDTKIIWYKIVSEQEPEEIFMNFNQGKIPLEQAELIKALFVLELKKETNEEVRAFKTGQFADEWNTIENQLQDDKFWYFVSNDDSDKKKANRIDFLFDVACKKPRGEQNELYAYHQYLKGKKIGETAWEEIKRLFDQLHEWFLDRTIYHLLGLLIYLEIKRMADVHFEYQKLKDKDELEKTIKDWIKTGLSYNDKDSKYQQFNLTYHDSETFNVLLIFNIATYQVSDINYRFPFDKLKTQDWSLEHIHAQKADAFKKIGQVRDWLLDIRELCLEPQQQNSNVTLKEQYELLHTQIADTDPEADIPRAVRLKMTELNNLFDQQWNWRIR
jgi:hypothetical protein